MLRDRAATARVIAGGVVHDDLPIMTARADEPEDDVMSDVRHGAVLLKEKAATAFVRLPDGESRSDVPIFKERVKDPTTLETEEIRVQVHEIRERAPEPSAASTEAGVSVGERKGFLSRMFGRT